VHVLALVAQWHLVAQTLLSVLVPQGRMTSARQFTAGNGIAFNLRVPQGRLSALLRHNGALHNEHTPAAQRRNPLAPPVRVGDARLPPPSPVGAALLLLPHALLRIGRSRCPFLQQRDLSSVINRVKGGSMEQAVEVVGSSWHRGLEPLVVKALYSVDHLQMIVE
jgi:hypothetical protein